MRELLRSAGIELDSAAFFLIIAIREFCGDVVRPPIWRKGVEPPRYELHACRDCRALEDAPTRVYRAYS